MWNFGLPEIFIIVFIGLFGLFATAFWIWALVDCIANEPRDSNDRIVWVVVIAITHFFGALLYFFLRRPKRLQTVGA